MIHVVTPFSRPENRARLVEHLEPLGIQWHPICHEPVDFPALDWIKPMRCGYPQEWLDSGACCYWKMNRFIEAGLVDEDYYCVLCDDDLYGTGFFKEIGKHSGDIIIPSMYEPRHGLLLAAPENMKPSRCSFQQLVIKGRVFKGCRYNNSCQADGQLIEQLSLSHRFVYAPQAVVMANSIL